MLIASHMCTGMAYIYNVCMENVIIESTLRIQCIRMIHSPFPCFLSISFLTRETYYRLLAFSSVVVVVVAAESIVDVENSFSFHTIISLSFVQQQLILCSVHLITNNNQNSDKIIEKNLEPTYNFLLLFGDYIDYIM